MKKLIFTFLILLSINSAYASMFSVDGINYITTNSNEVGVRQGGTYTGSITIPTSVNYLGETYSVTSIIDTAFVYCTGLTSITIPSSVTTIGDAPFMGCTGLININVNANNKNYASQDGLLYNKTMTMLIKCPISNTGNITIPSSVTSIWESAFSGCTGLMSINIPSSVTSIGGAAFSGCTGLTNLNIPSSITIIGSYAFNGCSGLTSITIPLSVTTIGSYAFDGTAWLDNQANGLVYAGKVIYCYKGTMPSSASISLAEGTSGITGKAFSGCTGLTSISIPASVTSIGDYAFSGCKGLTSITIPTSVTSIGDGTFSGCTGLTNITIPASVTSIGDFAFSGCIGLASITIPASVTSIGYITFSGCTGLTSITIPSSVTSIEYGAFEGCTGLTSLNIPYSVTSIGESAFHGCTGLTSLNIPASVTSIGESAFEGCMGLTSLTIPSSVTVIGDRAFVGCKGLTSINIPASVTTIGYVAFGGCIKLSSFDVDVNNANYSSKNGVLYNKQQTTLIACPITMSGSFSIPTTVTIIDDYAFAYCSSLISINIPSLVTSIGNYAFYNCTGLTNMNYNAINCMSMGSIDSPVFSGCKNITSVIIGNNVKIIPAYGFFIQCTGLTSLTIPSSVTSIGGYSFSACTGLASIYTYANVPIDLSSSYYIFYLVNKTTCTLYVPKGSLSAYKAAAYWKDFVNIVEFDVTAVNKPINSTTKITINSTTGTIQIQGSDAPVQVSVYNMNGLLVKSGMVSNGESLPVQSLPKGIYVVKVVVNKEVVSEKVVI